MNTHPIKVLLIEDSPTDTLFVRATLNTAVGAGFEVTTADHLDKGIKLANAKPFDVILLDLGLPETQGIETFERMHTSAPHIPIIILSGLGDDEVAMQAVQQGGQDYLPKGVVLNDLLPRAIHYAIERHRAQAERELYAQELQKRNEELEEDLRVASEIQQALLPHQYPKFIVNGKNVLNFSHRYRPAAGLSGDFFSILHLSDHQVGILICDVMGHGVRAALIGALTRGIIDQSIPDALLPDKFLSSLNRELSATLKQAEIDAFATAFYVVADLTKQEIQYANAGHPSAILVDRGAGIADWLSKPGHCSLPLGLAGATTYPIYHKPLASNDAIVFFTDGLYEAENAAGEQFGRERLLRAVRHSMQEPCEKLLDEIVGESQRFSGHEDFDDDVCLIGMDIMDLTPAGPRAIGL